ncbi:MAG TPA: chemotaxis protein CheD [Spirochaetota bacterium]|nr:chemotaxis protein CheD [Spirochaetota bacterium]HPI88590.1 chemotaxis protein CheD [Spirochaetota bacterium]HPR48231.1 chemotaxis protein CheD [Spirochaetota bacterium]
MDFNLINVGIADYTVSSTPDILRTILGSCVGICLFDPVNKVGGLSHIMLPQHKLNSSKKKYADSAIPLMVEDMIKENARIERIIAKIVGGSKMFQVAENSIMGEIGKNNVIKVREVLESLNISIIAEDVGGDYGRTIDFYLETGEIRIRSIGKSEIII